MLRFHHTVAEARVLLTLLYVLSICIPLIGQVILYYKRNPLVRPLCISIDYPVNTHEDISSHITHNLSNVLLLISFTLDDLFVLATYHPHCGRGNAPGSRRYHTDVISLQGVFVLP